MDYATGYCRKVARVLGPLRGFDEDDLLQEYRLAEHMGDDPRKRVLSLSSAAKCHRNHVSYHSTTVLKVWQSKQYPPEMTLEEVAELQDIERQIVEESIAARKERMLSMLGEFGTMEQQIVNLRLDGITFADAARQLGVNEDRARYLYKSAVSRMKQRHCGERVSARYRVWANQATNSMRWLNQERVDNG